MQALLNGSFSDQGLRTKIGVLTGHPGFAEAGGGSPASAQKNARHGAELVEDAGRLAGVVTMPESEAAEEQATVLPEAVLDCLGLLSTIARRAVTFFCSPSAYLPVAIGRSPVQRILVNLVKNAAAAAGPAGETVAVTLVGMREPGQAAVRLVLTVQGRGRGVAGSGRAKETLARQVADVEVQRETAFQVVRELTESSGGRVEVESGGKAGTRVSVSWPAMDPRRDRRLGFPRFAMARVPELRGTDLLVGGEAC